jgi:hypothetical protein
MWVGVNSVWEQRKLEARKMLAIGVARNIRDSPQRLVHALLQRDELTVKNPLDR